MIRNTTIAGFLLLVTLGQLAAGPKSAPSPSPTHFGSYQELDDWAKDCFGGGWCTKFTTRWNAKDIELCYTIRTFTSGVATTEVTFWQPDQKGGWSKTVGTGIMTEEIKVSMSPGGATLNAYDSATKSWIQWMSIATPLLCREQFPRP